jgi:hypothetical protein
MTCRRFPEHGKFPPEHDKIATGHDNRLHEHCIYMDMVNVSWNIIQVSMDMIHGLGKCPIEQGTCPPWHGKDFRDMI